MTTHVAVSVQEERGKHVVRMTSRHGAFAVMSTWYVQPDDTLAAKIIQPEHLQLGLDSVNTMAADAYAAFRDGLKVKPQPQMQPVQHVATDPQDDLMAMLEASLAAAKAKKAAGQ